MLRQAVVLGFTATAAGCLAPGASPPDIPPPPAPNAWEALTPGARVRGDGIAVYVEAGRAESIASAGHVPTPKLPATIRTQLWKMEGAPHRTFGVAFGIVRDASDSRACIVQLRADGAVRLARWESGKASRPEPWAAASRIDAERTTPEPKTGALVIREVLVSLDVRFATVSVDGVEVLTAAAPRDCDGGVLGVYADSGVVLRVPYLFAEPRR